MIDKEYIQSIDKAFISAPDLKRFDDRNVMVVSDKVVEIRRRRFSGFIYWLDHPDKKEKDVVEFVMFTFGVSRAQAYRDLQVIKSAVGNIKGTDKQFIRVELYEEMKRIAELAEAKGNHKQFIAAWATIGKYCNLDKEEAEDLPWDEIVPPEFEPDPDPKLIGLKEVKGDIYEYKEKMRKKWMVEEPEDVDFEEVKDDES